ncbi:MAG: hypothetical protein EXQ56_02305 [Acidobacteria bacterium]|nr:hypothetical protein [Acidobacteriota bacterium]
MSEAAEKVRVLIEKLLLHKGMRGVICRVFPPGGSGGGSRYTVLLEKGTVREQVFLDIVAVQRYTQTGNEQFVLSPIRAAIHNIERIQKKQAERK